MKISQDLAGFTVHPGVVPDAGDPVVVQLRYTGTGTATGKSLDAQVCRIVTFRDGKLTTVQQFAGTAPLQQVMGAAEPQPGTTAAIGPDASPAGFRWPGPARGQRGRSRR